MCKLKDPPLPALSAVRSDRLGSCRAGRVAAFPSRGPGCQEESQRKLLSKLWKARNNVHYQRVAIPDAEFEEKNTLTPYSGHSKPNEAGSATSLDELSSSEHNYVLSLRDQLARDEKVIQSLEMNEKKKAAPSKSTDAKAASVPAPSATATAGGAETATHAPAASTPSDTPQSAPSVPPQVSGPVSTPASKAFLQSDDGRKFVERMPENDSENLLYHWTGKKPLEEYKDLNSAEAAGGGSGGCCGDGPDSVVGMLKQLNETTMAQLSSFKSVMDQIQQHMKPEKPSTLGSLTSVLAGTVNLAAQEASEKAGIAPPPPAGPGTPAPASGGSPLAAATGGAGGQVQMQEYMDPSMVRKTVQSTFGMQVARPIGIEHKELQSQLQEAVRQLVDEAGLQAQGDTKDMLKALVQHEMKKMKNEAPQSAAEAAEDAGAKVPPMNNSTTAAPQGSS